MKHALLIALVYLVLGCSENSQTVDTTEADTSEVEAPAQMSPESSAPALGDVLDRQPDEVKARYPYRNPEKTLTLFDIQPGMTVAEVLPGRGWYSKILVPYLGDEGKLIGINYSQEMAGKVFPPQFQEMFRTFTTDWPGQIATSAEEGASIEAYEFGSITDSLEGSVDRILFIRALHHLSRSQPHGDYYQNAVAESYKILKPGGKVGIVQHESAEDMSDEWAIGSNGYLKKSQVIAIFESAGFELLEDSDINSNSKDQPTENDIVWRLPPSLRGVGEDEALKAEMLAIGESNRMTLVFKKP